MLWSYCQFIVGGKNWVYKQKQFEYGNNSSIDCVEPWQTY